MWIFTKTWNTQVKKAKNGEFRQQNVRVGQFFKAINEPQKNKSKGTGGLTDEFL